VSLETATPAARTHGAELLRILDHGLVRAVYQPIVELDTGALVGFEALARGPEDSALQRPDMLFAAAREAGLVAELEWACRAAAVAGALQGGLRPPCASSSTWSRVSSACRSRPSSASSSPVPRASCRSSSS
jgi:hypothetical protein